MATSTDDSTTTDGGDPILEGQNVIKIYNENDSMKESVRALEGVDFTVSENEFVAVVGPSGCGKTTLLHIFAGLVDASQGHVLYRGEPIRGPSTERAVVFQHFNLFPWRTVLENVGFGAEMQGQSKSEYRERAQEYIDLVNLTGFEDHYPSELSGGMKQRVGLARALTVSPDVLLMDEPFGALDAQTRELMQEELLRIWEQDRKTILFITHDIDEALMLADRVLVMGIDPRKIISEIKVPFERPRYDRGIEGTETYSKLKLEIWEMLKKDIQVK
jgi:NitT/TauT family transport system ATP-binding protein